MSDLFGLLPIVIILLLPIVLPFFARKWTMFFTSLIGYILYILWGLSLHFTGDITEYGTGYGLLIIPYVVLVTIVGSILQKRKNITKENRR